ncbi:unnamed protein product, partial [Ceratitis capitata]
MENSDHISVTLSGVGVNCTKEDGCSAKQYGQLQDIGAPPWSFPNDNLAEIKDMKLPDMRQRSKKSANTQESRKEGYIQAPLVDVPNKIHEPVVEAQYAAEDDERVDLETAVASPRV